MSKIAVIYIVLFLILAGAISALFLIPDENGGNDNDQTDNTDNTDNSQNDQNTNDDNDSQGTDDSDDDNQDTGDTTPTPVSGAEILSYGNYYDSINWHHVVGEVQNTGNVNLEYVKLIVTYYDSTNAVVGTDFTYIEHDILVPQQKSPFETNIDSNSFTGTPDSYKLQLTYSETSSNPYTGLEILSHSDNTDSIDWHHIVGEVKNTGSQTVNYVKLIVTYYDSSGDVVGTTFTFTDPSTLTPNQTAPFETNHDLDDTSGTIASYLIQVEG